MPLAAFDADYEAFDTATRIRQAVRTAGPQCERAVKALLWRLAIHPGQQVGRLWYTELSISYVRKVADVAYATARAAWERVRSAVGWASIHPQAARDIGIELRDRMGGHWGQHLLSPTDVREAAAEVLEELGGWDGSMEPDDPSSWVIIHPSMRGSSMVVRCPWHEDREPSMALYPNRDGQSGAAVCFACTRPDGNRLSAFWRLHGGQFCIRQARGIRQSGAQHRSVDTIEDSEALSVRSPVRSTLVLSTLDHRGLRIRRSRCPDLLTLLERAGRTAAGPAAWPALMTQAHCWDQSGDDGHRRHLPELYVGLDRMEPTEWRVVIGATGEVKVPSRWRPVETRHLAVDLDGFDDAPVGDASLAEAGRRLAEWAREHEHLSGGVAVTRTSHRGVQVVFELSTPRREPRWWRRTDEAKRLADDIENRSLRETQAAGFDGGHADPTARGAGRMIRRPGPRVDKDGVPCMSRLAYIERSKKNRDSSGTY